MTIKTGDSVPSGSFSFMGEKGPEAITTDELFNGKKVVLFAVPGAFTKVQNVSSVYRLTILL